MDSTLPVLPGWPNVAPNHAGGTDTCRRTLAHQLRAAFDISGTAIFTSSITAESKFLSLCWLKAARLEANQAEMAIRPKEVKVEEAAVMAEVTWCCGWGQQPGSLDP